MFSTVCRVGLCVYLCEWGSGRLEMRVMDSVVVIMKSFRRRSFPIRRAKRLSPNDRSKPPRTNDLDARKTRNDISPFSRDNRATLIRYLLEDVVEADLCLLDIKRRQKVVSSSCIQV